MRYPHKKKCNVENFVTPTGGYTILKLFYFRNGGYIFFNLQEELSKIRGSEKKIGSYVYKSEGLLGKVMGVEVKISGIVISTEEG